jgi:hypothetical protein
MALPLIVIVLAIVVAAVLAYGTDPNWAHFHRGMDLIIWSRQWQWPLLAVSVALCLILLVIVISGKRRAWWLIGLLPVLVLFTHRFITGPAATSKVVENPTFIAADRATFLHENDYIVGVRFADSAYAFPFSVLYGAPAVIQNDQDQRMILLWSPYANKATAYSITRDLKARDLEVVSWPANAMLLYNSRLGQFINGITAKTTKSQTPTGFRLPMRAVKEMWADWRQQYPHSLVMAPLNANWETAPSSPLPPRYPMPTTQPTDFRRVCLVSAVEPVAVPSDSISDVPLNLSAGGLPILVLRDALSGQALAFDRHVGTDLFPRFAKTSDARRPTAVMVDTDTATEWSIAGVALQGASETRGQSLRPLIVEDGLYWDVMKFWLPDLHPIDSAALATAIADVPQIRNQQTNQNQTQNRRRRGGGGGAGGN